MAEITTSAVRVIGELRDVQDRLVVIGVDCDAVRIQAGWGLAIRLDAGQREDFQKLFMEAERQAEAWAIEHAADDVVDAEIWCGYPGECASGPADHLWQDTCREAGDG